MSRALFLSRLKAGLAGMPDEEMRDIMADYEAHFAEGEEAGRNEMEVEAALGDSARLAKELRAEAGLKSWEEKRSPGNFLRATAALMGLVTLDFLVLLPLGFVFLLVIGVVLFVLSIVAKVGISLVMSLGHGFVAGPALVFAGLVIFFGALGAGALILLLLVWALRLFGGYVRLHYRVLEKTNQP